MVERYMLKEMEEIWSQKARISLMVEIELEYLRALGRRGLFEGGVPEVRVSPEEVAEREKITKHETAALVDVLEEKLEKFGNFARYVHFGLTSSDILDTALAVQMRRSFALIDEVLGEVLNRLEELARKYKDSPVLGRTHGMPAEVITFGYKFASWHAALKRARRVLRQAEEMVSFGKLSGAVGAHIHTDPGVEKEVLEKFGLKPDSVCGQAVPRDRHAFAITVLALLGSVIERVATDIRGLQRAEIGELFEPFYSGQKGSSAMPHKRNPVLSERLCGLARVLRGYAMVALENVALWHERDISHSSAERFEIHGAFCTAYYMVRLLGEILDGLAVDTERARENIKKFSPQVFSEFELLELVKKGKRRREAYEAVREGGVEVSPEVALMRCVEACARKVESYFLEDSPV